ncbi:MAG: PilZ domain-containing protein [Dehalococcoidia bacterium]|nr:PilZ domain-containing protein [Dehalococcoidia bacterium]
MSSESATSAVRVVWLQAGRSQCLDGTVARSNNSGVALELPPGTQARWQPQDRVMLVRGSGRERLSAPAAFAMCRGELAVFSLLRPWKAFDPRQSPRFPLHVGTRVQPDDSESFLPGTVLDISTGGLSVEVKVPVRAKFVQVPLWLDGYAATLRCEVVGTTAAETGTILHLRFHELEPAQAAFIRNMVRAIAEQFDTAGQKHAA